MTQFNPENLTEDQIITLLQMLFTNMNNLDKVYYDLFINEIPMDITLDRYDEYGTLNTYVLPNRAKDKAQVYMGQGNPEGLVDAKVGSFYFDTLNKDIYYKSNQQERSGWALIRTAINFRENEDYIKPNGNGARLTNLNANSITSGAVSTAVGGLGTPFNNKRGLLKATGGDDPVTIATPNVDYATPDNLVVMTGMVCHFAGTIPEGWLFCDGRIVNRSEYSNLFAAIGTTYNDGTETNKQFRIPDLRGLFIRGLDTGRGFDNNRQLGTYQADEFKAHNHTVTSATSSGAVDSGSDYNKANPPGTATTSTTGGSETRPKNIALYPCIKY